MLLVLSVTSLCQQTSQEEIYTFVNYNSHHTSQHAAKTPHVKGVVVLLKTQTLINRHVYNSLQKPISKHAVHVHSIHVATMCSNKTVIITQLDV